MGELFSKVVADCEVGAEDHSPIEIQHPCRSSVDEAFAITDHDQDGIGRTQTNNVERSGNRIGSHRRRVGEGWVNRELDLVEQGLLGPSYVWGWFTKANRCAERWDRVEEGGERHRARSAEPLVGQVGSVNEITDRHQPGDRHHRCRLEAALLKAAIERREKVSRLGGPKRHQLPGDVAALDQSRRNRIDRVPPAI